jgi:uncharacterized membrane protein
MSSKKHEFKTATFEDGTCVVLRSDPAQPHFMELIATFHDTERARDYAKFENSQSDGGEEQEAEVPAQAAAKQSAARKEPAAEAPKQAALRKEPAAEAKSLASDISDRQQAVLDALRSMMDRKNHVEVRSAELAQAAYIPLGSLHSVLASLEKKNLIRTERQGSAKFRAIYEVLHTQRKRANSVNGSHHDKKTHAVEAMAD